MSHFFLYPPDPDCPKCGGSGARYDWGEGYSSYGECGCRHPDNVEKIRERCDHAFSCKKCGREKAPPPIGPE